MPKLPRRLEQLELYRQPERIPDWKDAPRDRPRRGVAQSDSDVSGSMGANGCGQEAGGSRNE